MGKSGFLRCYCDLRSVLGNELKARYMYCFKEVFRVILDAKKSLPLGWYCNVIEVRLLPLLPLITAVRELHFICLKFSCCFSKTLD